MEGETIGNSLHPHVLFTCLGNTGCSSKVQKGQIV